MPYRDPDAAKAYRRAYHEKNRDKYLKRNREWRLENLERERQRDRDRSKDPGYRVKRREYEREYNKRPEQRAKKAARWAAWKARNPTRIREMRKREEAKRPPRKKMSAEEVAARKRWTHLKDRARRALMKSTGLKQSQLDPAVVEAKAWQLAIMRNLAGIDNEKERGTNA